MSIGACLTEWLMILLFQCFCLLYSSPAQHSFTICQLRRYKLCIIWLDVLRHRLVCVHCTSDFHHLFRIKIFIAAVITVDCCEIEWFFSHVRTRHALREDLSVRWNEGKWAWYVIKNVKSLSRCHSLSSMHTHYPYPTDSSVCCEEWIRVHKNIKIISLVYMRNRSQHPLMYLKCISLNVRKPEAEREREMITIMFIRQICHLGKYNQYQYPLIWWSFQAKKKNYEGSFCLGWHGSSIGKWQR